MCFPNRSLRRASRDGRVKPGHDGRAGGHDGLTQLKQAVVKIFPVGILCRDQVELPRARPSLDTGFALDRDRNVLVSLNEDHASQVIAPSEPRMHPLSMFPCPPHDIVRDAGIDHAEWPVRHDIDPTSLRNPPYALAWVDDPLTSPPREMAGPDPTRCTHLILPRKGVARSEGYASPSTVIASTNAGNIHNMDRNPLKKRANSRCVNLVGPDPAMTVEARRGHESLAISRDTEPWLSQ